MIITRAPCSPYSASRGLHATLAHLTAPFSSEDVAPGATAA
jgi:hypothetical protein